MHAPVPTDPTDAPIVGLPSQTVRTTLTFLLFFHLFALFVAVVSNRPSSVLLQRLRKVPGPYLQFLGMDLSYRFEYTQGEFSDRGWLVEADIKRPEGIKTVVFPEPGIGPDVRKQRYATLARGMGTSDENLQAVLVQAVGARLLTEHNAQELTLRVRAHELLSAGEVRGNSDPNAPQRFQTMYEANLKRLPNGDLLFIKKSSRGESAPSAKTP